MPLIRLFAYRSPEADRTASIVLDEPRHLSRWEPLDPISLPQVPRGGDHITVGNVGYCVVEAVLLGAGDEPARCYLRRDLSAPQAEPPAQWDGNPLPADARAQIYASLRGPVNPDYDSFGYVFAELPRVGDYLTLAGEMQFEVERIVFMHDECGVFVTIRSTAARLPLA